jgi:hypothetical protein
MKGLPAESAKTMTPPASRSGLMAAYRYRSIPKLVQDGSVWLMIGKFRLRRQDKLSILPVNRAFEPRREEV